VKSEPPKLGTVIEDLEHVLVPLKLLGVFHIVSPLGVAENLGKPDALNLKPPLLHNPLSKFIQILTVNASEAMYKMCKFCENCARNTLPGGVYIPNFGQILVKKFSFGVLYPYRCTNGVKFGMEEWTLVHSSMPHFTPIGATCRP